MKTKNEYGSMLVNIENSMLAKELGYDIYSPECWVKTEHGNIIDDYSGCFGDCCSFICYRTTYSNLREWIKDKFEIYIEILIDRTSDPKYCYRIWQYKHFGNWTNLTEPNSEFLYSKYDECLEDAISKSLNLIKL